MLTDFISLAELASIIAAGTALYVALSERKKRDSEREKYLAEATRAIVEPLTLRITVLEREIETRTQTIIILTKRIDNLEWEISTRDKLIASMGVDLEGKKTSIVAMQEELRQKSSVIAGLEKEIAQLTRRLDCVDNDGRCKPDEPQQ